MHQHFKPILQGVYLFETLPKNCRTNSSISGYGRSHPKQPHPHFGGGAFCRAQSSFYRKYGCLNVIYRKNNRSHCRRRAKCCQNCRRYQQHERRRNGIAFSCQRVFFSTNGGTLQRIRIPPVRRFGTAR